MLHDLDIEIRNADLKVHGLEAEKIGVPLNEFVELSVDAMKEIAPQLGL